MAFPEQHIPTEPALRVNSWQVLAQNSRADRLVNFRSHFFQIHRFHPARSIASVEARCQEHELRWRQHESWINNPFFYGLNIAEWSTWPKYVFLDYLEDHGLCIAKEIEDIADQREWMRWYNHQQNHLDPSQIEAVWRACDRVRTYEIWHRPAATRCFVVSRHRYDVRLNRLSTMYENIVLEPMHIFINKSSAMKYREVIEDLEARHAYDIVTMQRTIREYQQYNYRNRLPKTEVQTFAMMPNRVFTCLKTYRFVGEPIRTNQSAAVIGTHLNYQSRRSQFVIQEVWADVSAAQHQVQRLTAEYYATANPFFPHQFTISENMGMRRRLAEALMKAGITPPLQTEVTDWASWWAQHGYGQNPTAMRIVQEHLEAESPLYEAIEVAIEW